MHGWAVIKGLEESPAPSSCIITSLGSQWSPGNTVREAPALGHVIERQRD